MNQQQQPIYYVQAPPQQRGNGCLLPLAAVGVLAIVAFLWMLWGTVRYAGDVNQVPAIFGQAVQTLEPISPAMQPQPGIVFGVATGTPQAQQVVQPTQTPYPTYTAVPAQTFGDYGLPNMGPYTLDQVTQCRDIITAGNLNTLQSPQRELCVQYVGN